VANLDIFLSYISHGYGPSASRDFWIRFDFPDKADGARPETGRDNAWKFAHPYHEPLPANLAPTKLIQARFHDVTPFIDEMRNIKTPQEIEVLRRNGKISAEGDKEAIAHARPGMHQYQIEARATGYFMDHGAQGVAHLAIRKLRHGYQYDSLFR
jgi:Xaa-Pro aminopeptidase